MIANLKIGNMKIIETGNRYGSMTTASSSYPMNYTLEKRKKAFLNARMELGKDYGFDGHKIFKALQNDKTGTYFEITNDYVEANPNGWSDINEDILIVTSKTPKVVIGHSTADFPVVMAYDKKQDVLAIGYCSGELIDIKMPELIVNSLQDSHKTKDDDVVVYVSACAGKSLSCDKYPSWAKDEQLWKGSITEGKNNTFNINLRQAILKQLSERNVKEIMFSIVDTIKDFDYYSSSASKKGKSKKKGYNFSGAFIKENRNR